MQRFSEVLCDWDGQCYRGFRSARPPHNRSCGDVLGNDANADYDSERERLRHASTPRPDSGPRYHKADEPIRLTWTNLGPDLYSLMSALLPPSALYCSETPDRLPTANSERP